MEVTQENVDKLAEILRSGKFDKSLETVQAMIDVAKDLIERYPEVDSLEELHEIFEKEQEALSIDNEKTTIPDEKDTKIDDRTDNDERE